MNLSKTLVPILAHFAMRKRVVGGLNTRYLGHQTAPPWLGSHQSQKAPSFDFRRLAKTKQWNSLKHQSLEREKRRSNEDDQLHRPQPSLSKEESTFWLSVVKRELDDDNRKVPCVPNLDSDGPLPLGAYRLIGNPEHDPAKMCLITLAVDLKGGSLPLLSSPMEPKENIDRAAIVRNMQNMFDSGFTTFQLAGCDSPSRLDPEGTDLWLQEWGEEQVYGLLRKETPGSVFRAYHLTTKLKVPSMDSGPLGMRATVRETVLAKLARMGGEAIDTLQLQHMNDSPHHLDVLEILFDMQREGFVREVAGLNMPASFLRTADECGFHLVTNQIQCNLLDHKTYDSEMQPASAHLGNKILVSSPLAGGLLTDNFLRQMDKPHQTYMNYSEQKKFESLLAKWVTRQQMSDESTTSDSYILATLSDISHKHQVSVASVALRWSLQLDEVGSVVVGSGLGIESVHGNPSERPRELREVFSFALDGEDMDRLWAIGSGKNVSYQ